MSSELLKVDLAEGRVAYRDTGSGERGLFIGGGRRGGMPHDKALKNMELFARDVTPHFR